MAINQHHGNHNEHNIQQIGKIINDIGVTLLVVDALFQVGERYVTIGRFGVFLSRGWVLYEVAHTKRLEIALICDWTTEKQT